jgi:predicted O-methyltransferase YrrM
MKGNIAQKFGRLIGNLAERPDYISRYVTHNVLNHKTPLDLEIPWFSYAAIDFLEKLLRPGMAVCEYGSGGSTLFFARRVRSVYSIENNPNWFKLVSQRLKEKGVTNVELHLFTFDFQNPAGFDKSAYLRAVPDRPFDVYVIDGSEEWTQVRPHCFQHVEERMRPGGVIVLDDSWRYPSLRTQNKASRMEIFQSVGPSRPGVTSTDVFFY